MAQKGPMPLFMYIQSIDRILFVMVIVFLWCYPTDGKINDSQTTDSNAISETCQHAYRKLNSQQMARFVDASGRPGSGIYGGSTLWYGSYSECQKLADSRYCWSMFPGNITLVKNRKIHHIEWGVCMPDVCTSEDVVNDFEFFFEKVSAIDGVTRVTKSLQVKCAEDPEYTASVVITIILCVLLVVICLLATTMETLSTSYKRDKAEIVETDGHISMEKDPNERMPLLSPSTTKMEKNEGLCHQILHSFSMIRNIKSIMRTKVAESDLKYLHGIRVLSLFWIILLHVHFQAYSTFWPYDNLKDVMRSGRRLTAMFLNTAYGVDTFFVLSGLLVMYTNMNKKMKNNGETNWFKYYFHRFWRLTPSYMFVILLVAKLRPFFGAGPVWFVAADTSACSEHWWTNLLYLNNFLHTSDQSCIGQTWYLAADMQFFIISPIFFLVAYRYGFRPLVYIVGVTILASIIVTACLAANDDARALFPPLAVLRLNIFLESQQEEVFKVGNGAEVGKDIYFKPYCRIPPYVMGMVLGYVLYKQFSKKFILPWKFIAIMWVSAIALALTDVYAPYSSIKEDPHVWTKGERTLFWSLKWPIWGLCIVWLIFACHYSYAGLVKNILEAKFWIPLSRINYAAFLVHMDVITVLVHNIETPIHYTSFTIVIYFLSTLVLTYAIAFVLAVVVEIPFANLEALAWKKWEKK